MSMVFIFWFAIMKSLIKKIISYDRLYPEFRRSFVYVYRKKINAYIAAALYGNASDDFFVVGVTGTNGKTTTVNILHKILNDTVAKTVMISTATIKIGDKEMVNAKKMSSLDVYDLQSILAIAKAQGCRIAVLEVTSIGLEQYRFQ